MMKFINYLILCIEIGITQFFLIPSIVEDILEQKNERPDNNIFSLIIKALRINLQEFIPPDAGWIGRFLLATILTLITLPLIISTLIIAPIAWAMGIKVTPATKEESELEKNTKANTTTTKLEKRELILQLKKKETGLLLKLSL